MDKLCTAERTLNELHLTEDSTSRYNVDYIMTCCTECERSLHMLGAEFHTPLVEQAIMLLQRDVALLNALLEAHDKVQANMSPLELDREDYWYYLMYLLYSYIAYLIHALGLKLT